MNHFVHLYLARPTVESRVGNLLGDFARGVNTRGLPEEVREGLDNHRAVDAFTDAHPEVMACKTRFSSQRRRFAGIALDILFDHYLLRHWDRFGHKDNELYISELYQDLEAGRELMPDQMRQVVRRMIDYDWFRAYQDLGNVGKAMDRVASRIRFPHHFHGVIEEIRPLDSELEHHFLAFFPDLIEFNRLRHN
ncbi:Acyl carrier protein phosphodiesterase [Marinobacter daqiaonensis]|uniref:Acyl carrier protein phosphodiesterase n=1 Tax=Marinobacter daqiaonensis TaxID=650891 RepID=A0A1I6GRM5_9GAMM|nr:ACP phosphodiesterase [Marinobacter daqiaonensis]SFR44895.1 Acyl carrier protein phosphodiesterase [Marinobacter daqiaonensis]